MRLDEVMEEFRAVGALREGHFVLSSGLHSPVFLQKNLVFAHPERCERLCKALAERVTAEIGKVDIVVSPAMGGVIPGYETARQLGVPALYVERVDGAFALRRGFRLEPGQRVLMVEDIVTTGLSSRECICVVDRSGGRVDVGVPLVALARMSVPAYPADELPPELAAIPVEDPGSRRLKA